MSFGVFKGAGVPHYTTAVVAAGIVLTYNSKCGGARVVPPSLVDDGVFAQIFNPNPWIGEDDVGVVDSSRRCHRERTLPARCGR